MPLSYAGFPPHFRLMLSLAADAASPGGERIPSASSEPAQEIDWQEFLAVTFSHKLGPLVTSALETTRFPGVPDAIPDAIQDALRRNRDANRLRVMRILAENQRIARRFTQAGFELTPLKGATLSQALYGSPAARHCGDLDLLAADREVYAQLGLLAELGYQISEPLVSMTPPRLRVYKRFWKGLTFRHPALNTTVDLHWRLFNNPRHPANRLNLRADPAAGTAMPPDQFLYSVAHGVSDCWVYLKGLADVAAFLRSFPPAELERQLVRAAELSLLRQVSSAVHLANEWMGTAAAHPMLLAPDDPFHTALRATVLDRLRKHDFRPQRAQQPPLAALSLELTMAPGWKTGFETARRYLWRPRVWSLVDLPDRLLWLHPVLGLLLPPR